MFDRYLKMLSNVISDNAGLGIVRKELEDSVIFEKFFNEQHGKDYYIGICLTEPIARQNKNMVMTTSLYNPIKIRIPEIHDGSLPNPCSPDTKDPFNVISRHPIAFGSRPTGESERTPVFGEPLRCYFSQGPDDFGKLRGIRYEYPTKNVTSQLKCANKILRQSRLSSLPFLQRLSAFKGNYSPTVVASIATNYDNDTSIPDKSHLNSHISKMHPQFKPIMKAFIYECWTKLKIQIKMGNEGSGFRSPAKARAMRATWDAWVALKPKKAEEDSAVYKAWLGKKPYVQKPAQYSHHNSGTGMDFNPVLSDGTTIHSSAKNSVWLATGVIDIAKDLGLRWGGNFTNRDAVHIDMEPSLPQAKRIALIKEAARKGISPVEILF